jgi:GTP-binding protein
MANIRNVAIIAHVDHGKTTLIDNLLKQSNTFRSNESYMSEELIMDSNDQERERGITILAKNTSVTYNDTKINIIDTPGHADFGGEVERTLNMADGVLLLVDAQEGVMPQTKFVLQKALQLNLKVAVVVNKIDKKDADIKNTLKTIDDLFLELATDEEQLHFPTVFAVGRDGKAWNEIPQNIDEAADLKPLFELILNFIPAPTQNNDKPFRLHVNSLSSDNHLGKLVVGRVNRGIVKPGDEVVLVSGSTQEKSKIDKIFTFNGLKMVELTSAESGDIVSIAGCKNAKIGDTICSTALVEPMPTISIEEPTLSIDVGPNTSPFMGKEGEFVTSRQILERVEKELETNIAMKMVKNTDTSFTLFGRGELHLSVFLETLRRESYELQVGKPKVVFKEVNGVNCEPVEQLSILVNSEYVSSVQSELLQRRAVLVEHSTPNNIQTKLVYNAPSRAVLGLRSILLTLTKGTIVVNSSFLEYAPIVELKINKRNGVLIASASGKAGSYGLDAAQNRGTLFIGPGTQVYEGMVVGLNSREADLEVNVCKEKHLTNTRSSGNDDAIILTPPTKMSLEQCLNFIEEDELLEITPENIRIRKKHLTNVERVREERKKRN